MSRNAKREKVLDIALALLKTEGDFGVTMRKVAGMAEMSLSNVQYYFKTKDALLIAMADRYFQQCLTEIAQHDAIDAGGDQRAQLENLLREFLAHGLELSEMCRIFREYWAIATRNDAISEYLESYYTNLADILVEKLQPIARNESAVNGAVSLMIPYFEGYSITAKSLPESVDTLASLLTDVVLRQLQQESR